MRGTPLDIRHISCWVRNIAMHTYFTRASWKRRGVWKTRPFQVGVCFERYCLLDKKRHTRATDTVQFFFSSYTSFKYLDNEPTLVAKAEYRAPAGQRVSYHASWSKMCVLDATCVSKSWGELAQAEWLKLSQWRTHSLINSHIFC